MVSRRWVVNASPLILLGKTDNLHLLAGLADVVAVPRAVAKEVGTKPDGEATLQILARNPTFARADDETVNPEILSWDLVTTQKQPIHLLGTTKHAKNAKRLHIHGNICFFSRI